MVSVSAPRSNAAWPGEPPDPTGVARITCRAGPAATLGVLVQTLGTQLLVFWLLCPRFALTPAVLLFADDGKLSLEEFQAFFSDGTLNEEELEKLFHTIDSDNTK